MTDTIAIAQPQLGQVVSGEASISSAQGTTLIQQSSQHAIVDWQRFSVPEGQSVNFRQPSVDAAILNRVTGHLASHIDGQINANGQVYLVNPNGVVIGESGVITAGGFVASTLDISNEHFLADRAEFSGQGGTPGILRNLGTIEAVDGDVLLMAGHLVNQGDIRSTNGSVLFAAGTKVLLTNSNESRLFVQSEIGHHNTGIDAGGVIEAAQVEMQAAGGSIYDMAINQTGLISAKGTERRDGRILLTADSGSLTVVGTLSASNSDGSGGEVLVGGGFQGLNDAIVNADSLVVSERAEVDVSAETQGDGGTAIFWSDGHTTFRGSALSRGGQFGGDGGLVEVSGKQRLSFNPQQAVNLLAPAGHAGTLMLDPDDLLIVSEAGQRPPPQETTGPPTQFTANAGDYVGPTAMGGSELTVPSLIAALNGGNVVLQASGGILTPLEAVDVDWSAAGTNLTLNAGEEIDLSGNFNAGTGSLILRANGNVSLGVSQPGTIAAALLDIGAKDASSSLGTINLSSSLDLDRLNLDFTGSISGDITTGSTDNKIDLISTSGNAANLSGDIDIRSTTANHDTTLNVQLSGSNASRIQLLSQGDINIPATAEFGVNGGELALVSTGGSLTGAGLAAGVLAGFDASRDVRLYSGLDLDLREGEYPAGATTLTGETFSSLPPASVTQSGTVLVFRAGAGVLSLTANDLSRLYGDDNPALTYSVSGLGSGDTFSDVTDGAPALSTSATVSSGVASYAINITQNTLTSDSYRFSFIDGSLTVNAAPLTLTPKSITSVYGDTPSGFDFTYDGFRNGDDASIFSDQLPNGITVEGGLGEQFLDVGSYNITANGGRVGNYNLLDDGADNELTITAAPLTVTFKDYETIYGSSQLTDGASFTGLKRAADESTVSVSATTTATSASDVGTYVISGSASAPNYTVSTVNGTLNLKPRPLALIFDPLSREYGLSNPTFSAKVSGSGFVNGDTLADVDVSFTTLAEPSSDAGVYAVTLGATSGNYSINNYTLSNGLTINKAALALSLSDASKTYGQVGTSDLFVPAYSGLRDGDADPVLENLDNIGLSAISDVGTYATTGATLAPGSNYFIDSVTGGELLITPAVVDLTVGLATKVYGDTELAVTGTSATGLAGEQAISVLDLQYDSAITDPLLAAGSTASVTAMLGSGVRNYTLGRVMPGTATVTKRALSAFFARRQRFYGETLSLDNIATLVAYSGFVNGDSEADLDGLVVSGVHDDAEADVGLYQISAQLTDTNYTFAAPITGSVDILPRRVSVSVADGEKIYGDVFSPVVSINNLASFDTTADLGLYDLLAPGSEADANVGTYNLQAVFEDTNYEVVSNASGKLTVLPRSLDIFIDSQSVMKPYTSDSVPFGFEIANLAAFDTVTGLGLNPVFSVAIPSDAPAARYDNVLVMDSAELVDANYVISTIFPGDLEVLPDSRVSVTSISGISVTDVTSSSVSSDETLATEEGLEGDGGYNTGLVVRDATGSQPMTAGLYNAFFADSPSTGLAAFLISRSEMLDAFSTDETSDLATLFRDYAEGRISGEAFNAGIGAMAGGPDVIIGIMGDYAVELANLPPEEFIERPLAEQELVRRLNLRTQEIGYEFADRLETEIAVEEERQAVADRGLLGVVSASRFGNALSRAVDGFSAEHAENITEYVTRGNTDDAVAAVAGLGAFAGGAVATTAAGGGALLALATATSASAVGGAGGAAAGVTTGATASSVLSGGVSIHAVGTSATATAAGTTATSAAATAAIGAGVFVVAAAIVTLEVVQQVLAQEREDAARGALTEFSSGYSYADAPDFLRNMALQELLYGPARSDTTRSRLGL